MEEIGADNLMGGAVPSREKKMLRLVLRALLAANDKIRSTYRPRGDFFTIEWEKKPRLNY